jgi:hypothetical protein
MRMCKGREPGETPSAFKRLKGAQEKSANRIWDASKIRGPAMFTV